MSPNLRSRPRTCCNLRNQSGVTLIEVLVSLLLFSIGVLGMVAMQAKAIAYSVSAEDRSRAANLAAELIATMWTEGTTSPSNYAAWQARVQDAKTAGLPNAAGSVADSTDSTTGIKTTTVTITWKAPAKAAGDADSSYFTQVVIP